MRISAIIISFFASIWWTVAIWASNAAPLLYCIPIVVSVFIIVAAFRQAETAPLSSAAGRRSGRIFGIASAFEGAALLAAFAFFPGMQSLDFSVSVQAIIVGLHFILIAYGLSARLYYLCAALLIVLGATGFAIGDFALHIQYVCIGAACTLWFGYAMAWRASLQCRRITSGATC